MFFFFFCKVKAEFAFTRLCRDAFYKMALFEVTELLCVCVFVDMLSRFERYRCTCHRIWIWVTWSCWALTEDYVDRVWLHGVQLTCDNPVCLTGSHSDAALRSRMYSRCHLHEEKFSYCEQKQKYAFVDVDLPAWRCWWERQKKKRATWLG